MKKKTRRLIFFTEFVFRTTVEAPRHRENPLTHLQIKEIVAHEIRSQILDKGQTQSLPKASAQVVFPEVKILPDRERMRILVTGGSGFVGSHLVDRLMIAGHQVIVVDNMFTGRQRNVAHWLGHPNFQLIIHDVIEPIMLEVDQIYHLACPASPPHYQVYIHVHFSLFLWVCFLFLSLSVDPSTQQYAQYNPIKTIKTSTEGTLNMLGLAKRVKASNFMPLILSVFPLAQSQIRPNCPMTLVPSIIIHSQL